MYAHYSKILFHIVINPIISVLICTDHFFIFAFLMTDTIMKLLLLIINKFSWNTIYLYVSEYFYSCISRTKPVV